MAHTSRRDSLLALFEQTRTVLAEFVASRSEQERGASGAPGGWSAGEVLTVNGCWMAYMVERMEYYVRGDTPPRGVDFGAVQDQALAAQAGWSWEERVAACERALDSLIAEVRRFTDVQLEAHNTYGDDPGGPLWGEVRANGFICPLEEVEKYERRVGEHERADVVHRLLVSVVGEEEEPIVVDLTTPEALRRLREEESVIVIDVRGKSDYARGHVRGARHIPLAELPRELGGLPKDQCIVTYCDMHHPGQSRGERAAALLAEHGFRASAIAGGFPAYAASGLPVESEPA